MSIFFMIYTCDFVQHLKKNCAILYADDTNIMIVNPILQTALENASVTMPDIDNWCKQHNLIINPHKTEFLIFRTTGDRKNYIHENSYDKHGIEPSQSVKFLGLQLNVHMKYNKHTEAL